jgi:hypothetical protein
MCVTGAELLPMAQQSIKPGLEVERYDRREGENKVGREDGKRCGAR